MKIQESLYTDIIRVRKNKDIPGILDVELNHINELKKFHSLECHIVLYPYSLKLNARHFEFTPYEEYVNDIVSHHRSAYTEFTGSFNNIFGLLLGLLITVGFFIFKPADLFSVESIVSVFGAYFVGKQLWEDIERFFIDISKDWRIRYVDRYYFYRLGKNTALSLYAQLAKKRRYGSASPMPEKIDFTQKISSQTLRLFFNMSDFSDFNEPAAHIFSIRLKPERLQDFEREGFMFGVRLSFNKRFLGITRCREFFQSLDKDLKGCLGEKCTWLNGALFYRNNFAVGRVKCFLNKGILENKSILDIGH